MSVILTIIKKDLERHKGGIILFLLLLAARVLVRLLGTRLMLTSTDHFVMTVYADQVLTALQILLAIILIPLIVQKDSLIGTTAFWFTRPISRPALLGAKAVPIVILFSVLPSLINILVMLIEGMPVQTQLVLGLFLVNLFLVLSVFFLSTLTDKFSRFVLRGFVIFIVLIFGVIAYALLNHLGVIRPSLNVNYTPGMDTVRGGLTLTVFFLILFVIHQYLTRRTSRSVLGMCLAIVLVGLVLSQWQGPLMKNKPLASGSNHFQEITIHKILEEGDIQSVDHLKTAGWEGITILSVDLKVDSLPAGQFAVFRSFYDRKVYFDNDSEMISSKKEISLIEANYHSFYDESVQFALREFVVLNPRSKMASTINVFAVDENTCLKRKGQKGTFYAKGLVGIYQYQGQERLKLKGQKIKRIGPLGVSVSEVLQRPKGIQVKIVESEPLYLFFKESAENTLRDALSTTYVLINPIRHEAYLTDSLSSYFKEARLISNGQSVYRILFLEFRSVTDSGQELPKIDEAWLKDAELVRLKAVKVGEIEADIRLDDFYFPDPHVRADR